jgi:hypothetical protein
LIRAPLDRRDETREQVLREKIDRLRTLFCDEGRKRFEGSRWSVPVNVSALSSTSTRVLLRKPTNGLEFYTEGNIAQNSDFTFTFSAPSDIRTLTALRLDILPVDEVKARHTPEWGAVLSQVLLEMREPAASEFVPVQLAQVIADEPSPHDDPNQSLSKDRFGFGTWSKVFRPRWCVVILDSPVSVSSEATFRLTLKHRVNLLSSFSLVTQRGSFRLSDNPAWTDLVQAERWKTARKELASAVKIYRAIPATTVPVMREREAHLRRETRMFIRGNWLDKGPLAAKPDTPAIFPPLVEEGARDRLALSRWLVSPANPLTARVAVNRFWEQLFGVGLVETLEDFGSAGMKPTHPELLDYLALYFQEELRWDVKQLLRHIVTSATYRQASLVSVELRERDPQNRLMARGPRRRLKAEMVRDQALAVAGLLSSQQHGPPVRPPLPESAWNPFSSDRWVTATNQNRFRRGVYTYWKRSLPFPTFIAFDAPTREVCNQRRMPSNTPLQALTTLNDPAFVECATALAQQLVAMPGSLDDRLAHGFRLCTSRRPGKMQLQELLKLYEQTMILYQGRPSNAEANPEHGAMQAMQVVASVLLNLDVTLTK